MKSIIMKNLGRYLFPPMLLTAWTLVYGSISEVNNLVAFSNLLGVMAFFGGIIPIVMIEGDEEKHKGYQFLATLPLSLEKVVRAKGMMVVILVTYIMVMDIAFIVIAAERSGHGTWIILPSISRVVFGGSVCLLLGGAALVAIYRFGTYVVLASFGVLTFMLNLGTFFIFRKASAGIHFDFEGGFLSSTQWYHLVLIYTAGLAGCHYLVRWAVRVKSERRV